MKKQILAALAAIITVGIVVGAAAPGFAQGRSDKEHKSHKRDRAEQHTERQAHQDRDGERHFRRNFEPKIIFKLLDRDGRLSFGIQTAKHTHKRKQHNYLAPKRHRADDRNYRQWRKAQLRKSRHQARHQARQDHPKAHRGHRHNRYNRYDRQDRYSRYDRRWNGRHQRHG